MYRNVLRISANVWMQMGLNGSSACSATAMNALSTASERTALSVPDASGVWFSPAICMMVLSNLIACSFSATCLLSRVNVLEGGQLWAGLGRLAYLMI